MPNEGHRLTPEELIDRLRKGHVVDAILGQAWDYLSPDRRKIICSKLLEVVCQQHVANLRRRAERADEDAESFRKQAAKFAKDAEKL